MKRETVSPIRSGRHFRGRIVLVAAALVAGLVFAEVLAFTYEKYLIHVPHMFAPSYREDPEHIRLAVLGESTSDGWPYCENGIGREAMADFSIGCPREKSGDFNLLSFTQYFLEKGYGWHGIRVDNYSFGGWTAEQSIDFYWESATNRPDVMVLYSGHNETTCYYSPNMRPLPAALSVLQFTYLGRWILHGLFVRQVDPADMAYRGEFLGREAVPAHEVVFNKTRFRRVVEALVRHCEKERIFLIIVVPEGNLLYPPSRSVYSGPAERKSEALRLFKRAYYANHFQDNPRQAEAILRQLMEFCRFAHLYYELGMIYYNRGEYDLATKYLRQSIDADGFSITMPSDYKDILRDLAQEHRVPVVEMQEVITKGLRRPVPDFTCFLDNCHLTLDAYQELSRAIIRTLRDSHFPGLDLPAPQLQISDDELRKRFNCTPERRAGVLVEDSWWFQDEALYSTLRMDRLIRSLEKLQEAASLPLSSDQKAMIMGDIVTLKEKLRAEYVRLLNWCSQAAAE